MTSRGTAMKRKLKFGRWITVGDASYNMDKFESIGIKPGAVEFFTAEQIECVYRITGIDADRFAQVFIRETTNANPISIEEDDSPETVAMLAAHQKVAELNGKIQVLKDGRNAAYFNTPGTYRCFDNWLMDQGKYEWNSPNSLTIVYTIRGTN